MSDKKYGMLVDLATCIGCNSCVVACKMENDVPISKFNTWIESWDVDNDGRVSRANLPKLCNHCENPACVHVCPTGASYVADDGTVQIDDGRCIGCKYCMAACPYGVRYVVEETGDVHKCTLCEHRISNGLLPACTASCVTGARVFGDLNDPASDISKRMKDAGKTSVLLEDKGLGPVVHYIGLDEIEGMTRVSNVQKGGNVIERYEGRQ